MSSILNEFKAFAVKGNAVDMAVGVIIGGAFGKIVSSIVNDFVIIAFCVFLLVKGINKLSNLKKKEEEAKPKPEEPKPTKEELLLTEIRDLLKERK